MVRGMERRFIISYFNTGWQRTAYVCAKPGWYRLPDGTMKRDNPRSGPEWTIKPDEALLFKSHRAAARVANVCHGVNISEVMR